MNKPVSSESKFKARQSIKHRALVHIGRWGTEKVKGRPISDAEAAHYGKKRVIAAGGGVAGIAGVVALSLGAKKMIEDQLSAPSYRNRVAACATAIEGHQVTLAVDPEGDVHVSPTDQTVVAACETADGNVGQAEYLLDHAPNTSATQTDQSQTGQP